MRGLQQTFDLRYGNGLARQRLDVIAPKGGRNCPVVLFVHGGGWMIGDKNLFGLYRSVGQFFARHGMVAVMVNYRLSPLVKHPEHIKDVARAFVWTREHIRDYGGDPNQLILCGHSAGAHLVSLLATDPQYLADRDRAALRAVIAVSGVYRIPEPDEFVQMLTDMVNSLLALDEGQRLTPDALMPSWTKMLKQFSPIRMVFGDDPKVRMQASPLYHVRKGLPPFLLMYAETEIPKLRPMAREFRDALEKAETPVELCPIDGCNHNTILFKLGRPKDPTAQVLLQFLARIKGDGVGSASKATNP